MRCLRDSSDALWARDFQFDTTAGGRTSEVLNVIKKFTLEALAIEMGRGVDADGMVDALDRLTLVHGDAALCACR